MKYGLTGTLQSLRRLYFKVWWMDVVYPLLLSFILFWSLTYLLYSGQKHRRVSSQIETRMIYWSLWSAGPRVLDRASPYLTISLKEEDFQTLNQLHMHEYRDTNLINYAFLLDKLLDLGCRTIFIHWQADAFPHDSHYEPFFPLLAKAKHLGVNLFFVVHPTLINTLPPRFREHGNLLEADPCEASLQIVCVYDKVWDRWVMQKIPEMYWKKEYEGSQFVEALSYNLPPQTRSHLLYYNSYQDFIDFSFRDLLEMNRSDIDQHKNFFRDRTVFVGNSLVQGRNGMMRSANINRVKTVLDPFNGSARKTGTPLHKFWAQHAQMFHDDALIRIVPHELSLFFALLFAVLIIAILHWFGALYSLMLFLFVSCLGPVLNVAGIYYFRVYLPFFDILYAGFLSFLLATFAKLSMESFYHWRLRIEQKSDSELLSAKSHFISLLSHNLNTPVAKMQGILSAIEVYGHDPHLKRDIQEAQKLVSAIQLSIRSVLVTTALEEKELNNEAFVLSSFLDTFRESMLKTLSRLGVAVNLSLEETELQSMPVRFDRRALTMGLASFLILLAKVCRDELLHLRFEVLGDEERPVQVRCKVLTERIFDESVLTAFHVQRQGGDLLEDLARTVLNSFLRVSGGDVFVVDGVLLLKF